MVDNMKNNIVKRSFDDFGVTSEKTQIEITKTESTAEKELKTFQIESEKNKMIIRKYGAKIFNSVWYGQEVRVRVGGITHNMQANTNEWDVESVDEITLEKLLDLYTDKGDVILDPFVGYLNSGKVIYRNDRKLIANDINPIFIKKLKDEYNKHVNLHTGLEEPTFLVGDAEVNLENIPNESVDMVLTVLPTKERHLLGNYPYNFEKIINQIQRVLKQDKMAVFLLRDESNGLKETISFFDTILSAIKAKLNLQFINILALDDPEDERNNVEKGSISFQWHKMFYKNHYYIIGAEKL